MKDSCETVTFVELFLSASHSVLISSSDSISGRFPPVSINIQIEVKLASAGKEGQESEKQEEIVDDESTSRSSSDH